MKPNEIMIGDWVRRRYITKPSGQEVVRDFRVDQVRRLYKEGELYVWVDNGNMGTAEQMEPIPLTPEILEKNGFIYEKLKGVEDNEIWRIEDDYYDIDIYEWSDSIWIFRYDCNEMSLPHTQVTMSYVHELQHALRLCGIDKTIEL